MPASWPLTQAMIYHHPQKQINAKNINFENVKENSGCREVLILLVYLFLQPRLPTLPRQYQREFWRRQAGFESYKHLLYCILIPDLLRRRAERMCLAFL